MKKAVAYIRVSSAKQVKGESLEVQQQSIENYCKAFNIKLVKIFRDAGISGRTVSNRIALQNLLKYVQKESINLCIVPRLNRFGRNLRDTLNNVHLLEQSKCHLISLAENADFSNPYGKVMLAIMGSLAELQSEQQAEMSMASKIMRTKNGKPATGRIPWGRIYDKSTNTFSIDKDKQRKIEIVAEKYINGGNLKKLAPIVGLSYEPFLFNLRNRCGSKWTVKFPSTGESVTLDIPPLLDSATIKKIHQRIEMNRHGIRTQPIRKFLLRGFIRCLECHHLLAGQGKIHGGRIYGYYTHQRRTPDHCKHVPGINADAIEYAVLSAIYETTFDETAYKAAIESSLPTTESIQKLNDKLSREKKELSRIELELEKLVDAVINGTLKAETIANREQELLEVQEDFSASIKELENKLQKLPSPEEVQKDAEYTKLALQTYFASFDHFDNMSFDDKRQMLEDLFEGHTVDGLKRGVYLTKLEKNHFDYMIVARDFTGTRTLCTKRSNINALYNSGDFYLNCDCLYKHKL